MTEMKRYDCLVVDMVNFCYRTFKPKTDKTMMTSSHGAIYQNSIHQAINSLDNLCKTYLKSQDRNVYLLFDNYFSRADFQSTFLYADRKDLSKAYKANRKKESKEFYQSINFLRYYYLVGPSNFYTAQVTNLEADDLVKPLIKSRCQDQDVLLITTDLDWARYLSARIDWLPDLSKAPQSFEALSEKLGFPVSEKSIILYKAIFGDKADGIEALAPENAENRKQFLELLDKIESPEDLFILYRNSDMKDQYPLISEIMDIGYKKYGHEGRFGVNLQLVSAMPCAVSVLDKKLIQGRNAELLFDSIRKAIGLSEHKSKFVFGNLTLKKEQA